MKRVYISGMAIMLAACVGMMGCSRVGKKVGEATTDFGVGVSKGFDTKMMVKAEMTPEAKKAGLSMTIAKREDLAPGDKVIVVYMIPEKTFSGVLVAKAVNDEGMEVGRAKTEVKMEKEDGQYVRFQFPAEMDAGMVNQYKIDVVK